MFSALRVFTFRCLRFADSGFFVVPGFSAARMIFALRATLFAIIVAGGAAILQGCIGRRGRAVLQLRMAAALALTGFLLGAAALFFPIVGGIALLLLAAVYPFAAAFWLPLWCRTARFHATADAILLERGWLWQKTIFLSRRKIRYVTVLATPLQRALGVVSLRLMTAGGKVTLPQMERAEAQQLAALLQLPLAG